MTAGYDMTIQSLHLTAPSGSRVRIDLSADARVSAVAATVRIAGGSFGTGLQIGPRGQHEFTARHVLPGRQRERMLVHGREVVIAEADDQQASFASFIGPYHELLTVYAGPAPKRARVFALFSSLEIRDTAGGMVVRPRPATLLGILSEFLVIMVEARGTLTVPGPKQVSALVPKHAGARVKNGEVWRSTYPGVTAATKASDYTYVLACAAGMAEVNLADTVGAVESQQLTWLNDINVAWLAGD